MYLQADSSAIKNLVLLKAEADVDQFMLEGHKFPRFAKVWNFSCLVNQGVLSGDLLLLIKGFCVILLIGN